MELVGTAKRERQKANRQLKKVEEERAKKKAVSKKWVLRLGIGIPAILALFFGIAQFTGNDTTAPSTTVVTSSTVVSSTVVSSTVAGSTTVVSSTVAASTTTLP